VSLRTSADQAPWSLKSRQLPLDRDGKLHRVLRSLFGFLFLDPHSAVRYICTRNFIVFEKETDDHVLCRRPLRFGYINSY
jgi:hypothetical protein